MTVLFNYDYALMKQGESSIKIKMDFSHICCFCSSIIIRKQQTYYLLLVILRPYLVF